MVLDDFFSPPTPKNDLSTRAQDERLESKLASPTDRFAAIVADMVLFVPMVALAIAPFSRMAREAKILENETAWMMAVTSAVGLGCLAWIVYQTLCVVLFGGTPGKLILSLRVVSIWDQSRPRPIEAFIRAFVWCLEIFLCGIPWLALYSNEKRRPFHDRAADTAVIALTRERRGGLASLPEMSVASGFQSAVLAVLALGFVMEIAEYRSMYGASSGSAAIEAKLCPEVKEAISEQLGKKSGTSAERLNTAITLFTIDALDADCLSAEADSALWKGEEMEMAYLAKGLSIDDEDQVAEYFLKSCDVTPEANKATAASGNYSSVCLMAKLSGVSGGDSDEAPSDAIDTAEEKAEKLANENEIEKYLSAVDASSSPYLKITAIRGWLAQNEFSRALRLMDSMWMTKGGNPMKVGAYIAKTRAKALWQMGAKDEARIAMRTSSDLIDSSSRVEMAGWFCTQETTASGCSTESRPPCDRLTSLVDSFQGWLLRPEVSIAYIRSETCTASRERRAVDWTKLEEKIPLIEGKKLVKAQALIGQGKRTEAMVSLKESLSPKVGQNHFFSSMTAEAGTRLVTLARNADDMKPALEAWNSLAESTEGWRPLGQVLLRKFIELHAWDKAVAVGLKITKASPGDRELFEMMVVAAAGAGNRRMALGFLENALAARLDSNESGGERAPASVEGFEEASRDLLPQGKAEP